MDIEELDVEITRDGQVTLSVKGVAGSACFLLTEDLEAVLGNVVLDRRLTSEAGDAAIPVVQKGKRMPVLNRRKGK